MRPRPTRRYAAAAAAVLGLTACGGAVTGSPSKTPGSGPGSRSRPAAQGQTVSLWMWGGDPKGNAYVDGVLAHAAARAGVALRRVPIADTKDALSRILAEKQAGRADGEVDLVWVNGDDFATGRQAGAWACDWADHLPNARFLAPDDPLVGSDFGTDVAGCEAPWHKAQFSLVYDSARVTNPPTSLAGVLDWRPPTRDGSPTPHPRTSRGRCSCGRCSTASPAATPTSRHTSTRRHTTASPRPPNAKLADLAPSLWRQGRTYPRDSVALDRLFADGEVNMTMTYGPATLPKLVADGTFPATTRVLTLDERTVGNASFLAIPSTSGHVDGAKVVANLALSPEQQVAKADAETWGSSPSSTPRCSRWPSVSGSTHCRPRPSCRPMTCCRSTPTPSWPRRGCQPSTRDGAARCPAPRRDGGEGRASRTRAARAGRHPDRGGRHRRGGVGAAHQCGPAPALRVGGAEHPGFRGRRPGICGSPCASRWSSRPHPRWWPSSWV